MWLSSEEYLPSISSSSDSSSFVSRLSNSELEKCLTTLKSAIHDGIADFSNSSDKETETTKVFTGNELNLKSLKKLPFRPNGQGHSPGLRSNNTEIESIPNQTNLPSNVITNGHSDSSKEVLMNSLIETQKLSNGTTCQNPDENKVKGPKVPNGWPSKTKPLTNGINGIVQKETGITKRSSCEYLHMNGNVKESDHGEKLVNGNGTCENHVRSKMYRHNSKSSNKFKNQSLIKMEDTPPKKGGRVLLI